MSKNKIGATQIRMQQAAALAKIAENIVPQMFSENDILLGGEKGMIDEWKMTKISADLLLALIYCNHRFKYDGNNAFGELRDLILRGSKGINGFATIQGENIVTSLSPSGGKGRVLKKRGWVSRNITGRGKGDYEEEEEEE